MSISDEFDMASVVAIVKDTLDAVTKSHDALLKSKRTSADAKTLATLVEVRKSIADEVAVSDIDMAISNLSRIISLDTTIAIVESNDEETVH